MKGRLLLIIMLLCIVSCEPSAKEKISGTQDYSGIQFPITVYTYDNKVELNKAIDKWKPKRKTIKGFAIWFLGQQSKEMKRCEIHVLVPRGVADDNITIWGHELAHCIYGTFHKEPK